jgi:hypothetical protein
MRNHERYTQGQGITAIMLPSANYGNAADGSNSVTKFCLNGEPVETKEGTETMDSVSLSVSFAPEKRKKRRLLSLRFSLSRKDFRLNRGGGI